MRIGDKNFRINHQINAPEIRLLGDKGKQIGVVKIKEALAEARKAGLDLVEIAPNAKPPVVKLVELGKFKYEQDKKLQKQKRKAKASELKEVRFSPFIGDHDYDVRMEKIKEFLSESNKVRVVVVFKGRQMGSKKFGYKLIDKVMEELGDKVVMDMQPKFLGRHLATVISPVKKGNSKTEKEDK